jgi:predicted transcriptional regulator
MTPLPFSAEQSAALLALRHGGMTDRQLAASLGVGKGGVIGVTKVLHARGLIRFGGRVGKGEWRLTTLGASTAISLASPFGEGAAT